MTIFQIRHDPRQQDVLRGIYPIINIDPETDIDHTLDWATRLPDAGIKIVQVRAKRFDETVLGGLLDNVINDLRGAGLTVILNDYVELAGITGADGVHLGLDDFPIFEARALLGQKAIIGATVRNFSDALQAAGQGATYIAAGSIFESPTKTGIPVIGLDGLKEIGRHIEEESMPRTGWGRFDHIPICAIGGIDKENLKDVIDAGASMAAVIGAIQNAENPVEASSELKTTWEQYIYMEKCSNSE